VLFVFIMYSHRQKFVPIHKMSSDNFGVNRSILEQKITVSLCYKKPCSNWPIHWKTKKFWTI